MNLSLRTLIASLGIATTLATSASAANLTANACQIYIKKVFSAPSSHGTGTLGVVVKTGWIGNDETIEDVKFYGYKTWTDLGNAADCHNGPQTEPAGWDFLRAIPDTYYANQWGDYLFRFPVRSGSVLSQCPGYTYTWIGTFMVQTNKNTYWLNPNLNADEHFYFDDNAFDLISRKGGTYNPITTLRPDMAYYNPLQCQ